MKYLFIFLPFFCFAKNDSIPDPWDTIPKGGDSTLYGVRFDSTHDNFVAAPNSSGFLAKRQEFFVSNRAPKVVESFKYLGAYYELRENGWYKEIFTDTLPKYGSGEEIPDTCWITMGGIRIFKPGCSVNDQSGVEWGSPKDTLIPADPRMEVATTWDGGWKYCDEHLSEEKLGAWKDSSSVNVLIWDGCKLIQKRVDKFEDYTYSSDSFFFDGTLQPIRKNYSVQYAYKGKLIKFSYIIKEL